jgi:hypothetical protein
MQTNEIASIAVAFIVLAGITFAIAKGGETASILGAAGNAVSGVIRASTQR